MGPPSRGAFAGERRKGFPPRREEILKLVEEFPGICTQELCAKTGLTRTALAHHMRILVREGRVSQVRQGRRLSNFVPGVSKPALRSFLGLARLSTVRRMLQELWMNPTISRRALARRTGHAPHTVRWHLRRLEECGILDTAPSQTGEQAVRFHPDVEQHMGALMTLFDDPVASPDSMSGPTGPGPLVALVATVGARDGPAGPGRR